MKIEILPEARQELFEAVDYYEQKQLGLGKRFYTEIVEICSMILEHPLYGESKMQVFDELIVRYFRITSPTSFGRM